MSGTLQKLPISSLSHLFWEVTTRHYSESQEIGIRRRNVLVQVGFSGFRIVLDVFLKTHFEISPKSEPRLALKLCQNYHYSPLLIYPCWFYSSSLRIPQAERSVWLFRNIWSKVEIKSSFLNGLIGIVYWLQKAKPMPISTGHHRYTGCVWFCCIPSKIKKWVTFLLWVSDKGTFWAVMDCKKEPTIAF